MWERIRDEGYESFAGRRLTHSLSCAGLEPVGHTCCAHNADRGLRNAAHRLYPRYLDREQGRFASQFIWTARGQ